MAKKVTTKTATEPVEETAAVEATAPVVEETAAEATVEEAPATEEAEKTIEETAAEIAKEEAPTIEAPEIKLNTEPLEEIDKITKDFTEVKEGVEKAMDAPNPAEALKKELTKVEAMKEKLTKDIIATEKKTSPEDQAMLKNLMQTGQFGGYWNGMYETDSINL